jgi:hypothetical protein
MVLPGEDAAKVASLNALPASRPRSDAANQQDALDHAFVCKELAKLITKNVLNKVAAESEDDFVHLCLTALRLHRRITHAGATYEERRADFKPVIEEWNSVVAAVVFGPDETMEALEALACSSKLTFFGVHCDSFQALSVLLPPMFVPQVYFADDSFRKISPSINEAADEWTLLVRAQIARAASAEMLQQQTIVNANNSLLWCVPPPPIPALLCNGPGTLVP